MSLRVIPGGAQSSPENAPEAPPSPEQQAAVQAILESFAAGLTKHLPDLFPSLSQEDAHSLLSRVMQETIRLEDYVATRHSPLPNQGSHWGVSFAPPGAQSEVFGAPREPSTLQETWQSALVLALATSPSARAFLHLRGIPFTFVFFQPQAASRVIL